MIKVGLCGFTMAMANYSLHFPVVEVQQTFYEPPANLVMQRWLSAMPQGFEFTIKAWQLITHEARSPTYRRLRRSLDSTERAQCGGFRATAIVRTALARTLECARALRASAILFQCPASFGPDKANVQRLRTFFTRIANPQRPPGTRYLWEPRGPKWTARSSLAEEVCGELGLGYVVDPFVNRASERSVGGPYYRLHGIAGARHVYTNDELRRLRSMTPDDAHVMFNNIPRVGDAMRFVGLLGETRPCR